MSHQSEQNDQASNIIRLAVINGQIARRDFNMARRTDISMSAETRGQWNLLNDAIANGSISIIEDGGTVFPVTLTRDASGAVVDVDCGYIDVGMCSPSRQQTLTGANISAPELVPVPVTVPARIEPIYLQDDDVVVPPLFCALIDGLEME